MDSSWVSQHNAALKSVIKPPSVLAGLAIATVSSLGVVMAATNPSQAAYETYATQEAITFLDSNVCAEAPTTFGLKQECKTLLKTQRSQIRQFIAENTTRQNFVFFSIYTTELSIASFVPTYHVSAIGAFQKFHVVETLPE